MVYSIVKTTRKVPRFTPWHGFAVARGFTSAFANAVTTVIFATQLIIVGSTNLNAGPVVVASSAAPSSDSTEQSDTPLWLALPQPIQNRSAVNKDATFQLDLNQLQKKLNQVTITATFAGDIQSLQKKRQTEQVIYDSEQQAFARIGTPASDQATQELNAQTDEQQAIRLPLPTPDGRFVEFVLAKSTVMPEKLAAKYPDIEAYIGYQSDKPQFTGRFERTPLGFFAIFYQQDKRIVIDPIPSTSAKTEYRVYQETKLPRFDSDLFRRPTDRVIEYFDRDNNGQNQRPNQARTFGQQRHIYRLAISAAAEYTQFHGGTVALGLAAIVTAINRVNLVYERDLSINLQLVNDNDLLIFTNTATDPFDNTTDDIDLNTGVINSIIGSQSYDVGHIFNTAAGGLAGVGVVCTNFKGAGITGLSNPINDLFYIDFVAHELGHQFSADHTFNAGNGSCGSNRKANSAYEPGSGSTIMAYAGLCGSQNIQSRSDVMFHSHSINQIRNFIESGDGQFCGTRITMNNTPPDVSAGTDYVIPRSTPFVLSGQGSDIETSQSMSFSWEQVDLGQQTTSASDMLQENDRPLFRSFEPNNSPLRYLPRLDNLLDGFNDLGEQLPNAGRTLNFRLTGRDGSGGVDMDSMQVVVSDQAGPFTVSSPNFDNTYLPGQNLTVRWDVANTQQPPISCQYVDIHLIQPSNSEISLLLASKTTNDGQHDIQVPNQLISEGRIKISCSNNIFFNISDGRINIFPDEVDLAINGQQSISTNEDTPFSITFSDLFITDNILDQGDSLELLISDGDSYGYDGNTIYPAPNFNGQLNINIQIKRGIITSNLFTLIVDVIPINDKPVITEFNGETNFNEDQLIPITTESFTIYDVDASNPYNPDNIQLVVDNYNFQVTDTGIIPPTNFYGQLDIIIRATDGVLVSDAFNVSVNLAPINDTPIARNDVIQSNNNSIEIRPLTNDYDAEDTSQLIITELNYSGSGSVNLSEDKKIIYYQNNESFKGEETIVYNISDPQGLMDNATIRVIIGEEESRETSGGGSLGHWIFYLIALSLIRNRYSFVSRYHTGMN